MRLAIKFWALAAVSCAGQLTVDLDNSSCRTSAECGSGECVSGQCVGLGSNTHQDQDTDQPDPSADEKRIAGESCTRQEQCDSDRCRSFDGKSICVDACVNDCSNGFACFGENCVPDDFCEGADGTGAGPGCEGSPCLSCGVNQKCQARASGLETQLSNTFICVCADGYVLRDGSCELDPCAENPCLNGGFCSTIDGVADPVCACADVDGDLLPDFSGSNCEIPVVKCPDDEADNPCQNRGTCRNQPEGFACFCRDGFQGTRCEIEVDECRDNPCLNGGVCKPNAGTFQCQCADGFTGATCSLTVTDVNCDDNNPCLNRGRCELSPSGGFLGCDCSSVDFSGEFCTDRIDDCDGVTCGGSSECQDGVRDYVCVGCPAGLSGKNCDIPSTCDADHECGVDQYCNASDRCEDYVCEPSARECDGNRVLQCRQDGGGRDAIFVCAGRQAENVSVFAGRCVQRDRQAYCSCEDDWDCPANTVCDVDVCVGTGKPAQCRLEPEEFREVLPENEISWGGPELPHYGNVFWRYRKGKRENRDWRSALVQESDGMATDQTRALATARRETPYPTSAQVLGQPVVANLDDDNGDGLINELDVPEIIFMSFENFVGGGEVYSREPVLRAIHGGGPNRGRDYFASCSDDEVWHEGEPLPENRCNSTRYLHTVAGLAVADLNADGVPEIVATESAPEGAQRPGRASRDRILILDNQGELLDRSEALDFTDELFLNRGQAPTPSIANLDHAGFPEIVIGRIVYTLREEGGQPKFGTFFQGKQSFGNSLNAGPFSCVADVMGDVDMEIVTGRDIYRLPRANEPEFTAQELIRVTSLDTDQTRSDVPIDGFCAIADVLGANGQAGSGVPLDGIPEIIVVSGTVKVYTRTPDGLGFTRSETIKTNAGDEAGGPPNVDDFDGDGFPEIGTALLGGYAMVDLQAPTEACPSWDELVASDKSVQAPGPKNKPRQVPGISCDSDVQCGPGFACNEDLNRCVCEHNSWVRKTEDDSSRTTGSSVFDFNGDGAAEVVYNDECYFRIYDGLTGNVLFDEVSASLTLMEAPVVADVDNDGNAEIVFVANNQKVQCSTINDKPVNNGLEVWGDENDVWVSARRIWNQQSYHVTNITENAQVPVWEPKGWRATESNGRTYNVYRSNPRSFGVAPDLEIERVQLIGNGGACGQAASEDSDDSVTISYRIVNSGDLRVGPDVRVGFEGDFGDGNFVPLEQDGVEIVQEIGVTLSPGQIVPRSMIYKGEDVASLVRVRVTADVSFDGTHIVFDGGAERECDETNNRRIQEFALSEGGADLVVTDVRVSSCSLLDGYDVTVTIKNEGSDGAAASEVSIYAGDPTRGGRRLAVAPAPALAATGQTTITLETSRFSVCAPVVIWAEVDSGDSVPECNDNNNLARQLGRTPPCCFDGGG